MNQIPGLVLLQYDHPSLLKMHTLISDDEVEYKPLQMASITATLFHPSTPSEPLLGSSGIRGGGSGKVFSSIFHPHVLPKALHSSYPHFRQNFFWFVFSAFNLFFLYCKARCFLFVCFSPENCLYDNLTNISQRGSFVNAKLLHLPFTILI